MHAEVWFDGASKGNPGPAGAGAIVELGDERVVVTKALGRATNNEAEYHGIILGAKKALDMGARSVTLYGDSQLVIRQLEGRYRVKAGNLQGLWRTAIETLRKFPEGADAQWIRREENAAADQAANDAISV